MLRAIGLVLVLIITRKIILSLLIILPLLGIFLIYANDISYNKLFVKKNTAKQAKMIALTTTIVNFIFALIIFTLLDFSTNQFQFVQEYHKISSYNIYLGLDGINIYFVLLTTLIMPIAILSN